MEGTGVNRSWLGGFLIALTGAILFSTKAIVVKLAYANTDVDVVTLLALRMLFSLPFYIVAAWITTRQAPARFSKKQWSVIIGLGLFGYYLSSLFDFSGLQYVSAGLERLILFLYPSFVVLINQFVFKEKISRPQVAALSLTYAGIAIAYWGEISVQGNSSGIYWGSFLVFLCSITYAIFMTGSGRMIKQIDPNKFTAYAMLFATGGIFLHFLIGGNLYKLGAVGNYWGYGLLLAIFATVIPTFLLSAAIKKIGANNVAIISAIGPVSTIIQAYFLLNERIVVPQMIGTLLVIIGVLLIGWRPGSKIATAETIQQA